jgi:cyclase
MRRGLSLFVLLISASMAQAQAGGGPAMKFGDVREIAPGVFFRYSAISATDKTVVFGGCNNIWVVFKDYVVLFDANFPKEAGDVSAAIKKTTDKPIRYVVDSHHHGDHAYGNAIFAQAGASIVAQANCARLLRIDGPKEFADAGKGPTGRKDVAASFLKVPDVLFDDRLILDDGTQRAEFLFFGHAHTPGDAFMYLPKQKVLCTGDACTNGAFNFMGHADSASWIRVLDRAQQLDVKILCPGHGPLGGKEVLQKQQRYFAELREQVKKGLAAGKEFDDILRSLNMPWHTEWTGIEASSRRAETQHVYDELTGRIMQPDLAEDFGVFEGPSPTKKSPGWTKPKRIVVPALMPAQLLELKRIAPDVLFVPVKTEEEAAKEAANADAVLGFCSPAIVKAGAKLRWIQIAHAGVDHDMTPELVKSDIAVTNLQRVYGSNVAEQALGMLLMLTRGLSKEVSYKQIQATAKSDELYGKTMLIVGLGGNGTQLAKRANVLGMRVMAIDPKADLERPAFVFSISPPQELMALLPKADVVVLTCPLTAETRGLFGTSQFQAMKPSAYFLNTARGGLVKTPDLVAALQKNQIAGAGLDVTDPEPIPDDHPLWKMKNVVISPHSAAQGPEARDRVWRLYRENVRRFVAGEPLLCVVDKPKGY